MKHINEEDNYSKYYLKKYLQSGMGTLIFSQMTQIMKEPRYQLWPILVCKAKNPIIPSLRLQYNDEMIAKLLIFILQSLVFFLSEVLDLHLAK